MLLSWGFPSLHIQRTASAPTYQHHLISSAPNTATLTASPSLPNPPQRRKIGTNASPLSIPSCLDQSSVFYRVLTAQYRFPARNIPSYAFPTRVDPSEIARCRSAVDWCRKPDPQSDSSEDEAPPPQNPPPDIELDRVVYQPHGKWAWAEGLPIDDHEELVRLRAVAGAMCQAYLKKGKIAGRPIHYISKSWSKVKQGQWRGFHSELTLYKSEQYLKSLQGEVVPHVIGVFAFPGEINLAMEAPHHSFWIEASPEMPEVLKERCIEALARVHAQGVLHGDIELRHILIGGDAKVTLIDFQESRALVPDDVAKLQRAEPHELKLEMRKLKYKLDYADSRDEEVKKMKRCDECRQRNNIRRTKHKRRARGERPGYISDYEEDLEEDKADPPVNKEEFYGRWVIGADAQPRRFVVPGQTPESLDREIRHFMTALERLQTEKSPFLPRNDDHKLTTPPSTPPPDDTASSIPKEVIPVQEAVKIPTPTPRYFLRKRKRVPDLASTPQPRQRATASPSVATPSSSSHVVDLTDNRSTLAPTPLQHSQRSETSASSWTSQDGKSITNISNEAVPPLARAPAVSRFPPVKVRDFAYETYDGPRGYYVPHPPTEARAALERAWHITRSNIMQCMENQLPHPALLQTLGVRPEDDRIQRHHLQHRGKPTVQLGTLKRARDDVEDPDGARKRSARKKAKYQAAKAPGGQMRTRKRKREDDDLDGYVTSDEGEAIPEGPRILTHQEFHDRGHRVVQTPGASSSSSTAIRGILRKTKHARTGSHARHDWGADPGRNARLGSSIHTDVRVGMRANESVLSSDIDMSLDDRMMALATMGLRPISSGTRYRAASLTSRSIAIDSTTNARLSSRSARLHGKKDLGLGISNRTRSTQPPPQSAYPSSEDEVESLLHPCDVSHSPNNWWGVVLRLLHFV